jgi:hypothetical protein
MWASDKGHEEVVRLMIAADADVHVQDEVSVWSFVE